MQSARTLSSFKRPSATQRDGRTVHRCTLGAVAERTQSRSHAAAYTSGRWMRAPCIGASFNLRDALREHALTATSVVAVCDLSREKWRLYLATAAALSLIYLELG